MDVVSNPILRSPVAVVVVHPFVVVVRPPFVMVVVELYKRMKSCIIESLLVSKKQTKKEFTY